MTLQADSRPPVQAPTSIQKHPHDRVRLLTGATSWTLQGLRTASLRPMVLSDGPIGVRGTEDNSSPSAQLPSPSALAATWDRTLLAALGRLLAIESRRKGVDVVLAPVVNLQRTPYGGRHFEMLSEDPFLTGVLASSLIVATQDGGVGMCVKHFLGNESETDRTTYIARIPERALREVYLAPFERTVAAGVWSVMAAYNGVDDGVQAGPATEHTSLINGVLKGEWGFDGVVVSDWLATKSTVESALSGLDLVMPGPEGPWGQALEDAVRAGAVPESVIDDKVRRIVRLGDRVGATGKSPTNVSSIAMDIPSAEQVQALLRTTVARSTVVLQNTGLLPLDATAIRSIALIGPNAVEPFVQGGGSASVLAPYLVSPLQALREALPHAAISLHRGATSRLHAHPINPALTTTPQGQAGYLLTFFGPDGVCLGGPRRVSAEEGWNRETPAEATTARIEAEVRLDTPGRHRLEVGVSGSHVIQFDGVVVSDSSRYADHDVILDSSANHPDGPAQDFVVTHPRVVRVESLQQVVDAGAYGRFVRFALRHDLVDSSSSSGSELDDAIAAASAADVAIVIVGTNEETESEGWDRTDLALPGGQNALVEKVLAVNSHTVVVVNAGAPVVLPWLDQVPAALWWWLPGQEAGAGLADAVLGVTEPSGRLPWTLPADERDVPVKNTTPVNGVLQYSEGIHIGHRGWDRQGTTPAREFGFGLGYGRWQYHRLAVTGDNAETTASVELANTGHFTSRETIQLYLEAENCEIERPVRWLVGFATVDLRPEERQTVQIPVERRAFEIWDTTRHRWQLPDGRYRLHAAHSSRDLRLSATITATNGHLTY